MPNGNPVGADAGTGTPTATVAPAPAPAPAQPGEMAQPLSAPLPAARIAPEYVPPLNELPQQGLPPHSFGSKLYHGILSALGGSQDTTFSRDPATGQMIATTTPSTPGSQWKRIISGALTGFAGAQAAGTRGPGGTLRGFAGGIQAGAQRAEQQRTQARSEANEDYKAQLESATQALNRSLLASQVARGTWELGEEQRKADQSDLDLYNNYESLLAAGGAGTTDLGVVKTFQDGMKVANEYKEAHNLHAQGRTFIMPNVVNGKIDGVRVAIVTPDWLHSRTTEDHTFAVPEYKQVDGKWEWTDTPHTVPAGEMNETLMNWMMASANASNQRKQVEAETAEKEAQTKAIPEETKARMTEAAASLMRAKTDQSKAASEIALNEARAAAEKDKISEVDFGPDGAKGFNNWHKEMVQPALAYEQLYRMASQVYNEYQALRRQGKDFPSGAQSVQMLSNHIAGTFGAVKGARITKEMIKQHLGARGVSDELETAMNRLVSGDALSENQWNAFFQMIGERRNETWQTVYDDAKALGRPVQLVAFPDDFRRVHGIPARVQSADQALQQTTPQQGGGQTTTVNPGGLTTSAQPPQGATHRAPGSDGKTYWTDDKGTILGVVAQ